MTDAEIKLIAGYIHAAVQLEQSGLVPQLAADVRAAADAVRHAHLATKADGTPYTDADIAALADTVDAKLDAVIDRETR